jgi:hypothetical protein
MEMLVGRQEAWVQVWRVLEPLAQIREVAAEWVGRFEIMEGWQERGKKESNQSQGTIPAIGGRVRRAVKECEMCVGCLWKGFAGSTCVVLWQERNV